MHQHPRPPPPSASPATSEQTNPTRTNNPRDRDIEALKMAGDTTQGSGSSEDFGATRQDQPIDRLNQVIRNFHTKAALIILHSRVDLKPAYSKGTDNHRVNRWFNIELEETEDYKDDIRPWKTCDLKDDRPPPLVVEIFISIDTLNKGQRLVLRDEEGKRWDVKSALESSSDVKAGKRRATADNEVVLERWLIELGDPTTGLPPDMGALLPIVYKKSIVLFRSLYTYCNFLPAFKLSRKVNRGRSGGIVKLNYRVLDGRHSPLRSQTDSLSLRFCDTSAPVASEYNFGVTDSPAGPFSVSVVYRQNCEFQIDSSEEIISRQLLASDDDIFKPSLPQDQPVDLLKTSGQQESTGSLPTGHHRDLVERPELGHAYGSLSTFHQAGIGTSVDPMAALRDAQDYGTASPSPPKPQGRLSQPQSSNESSRTSLKPVVGIGRRSSFSFQPFKAPALSASPLAQSPLAQSPRPTGGRLSTLASLAEERGTAPVHMRAHVARKSMSLAPDQALVPPVSTSPKPASVPRYSSSFSHRRARLSSGGTIKTEDEQTSSGKGSAASSAQPGSGLVTEAAGEPASSGSVQEDDDNLNDFIQLLEKNKGLLTTSDPAAAEASTKRTTAALIKYHKMRDSNAALSDSLSSSTMGHRSSSSSSRQLSSVPPMIAATSVSTSSSPGKPISPHTPHTPFAPSRLSAAYSHDDTVTERLPLIEEPPSPSEAETSGTTTRGELAPNVPPIEIPNSPLRVLAGFRRSSSARRDTLTAEEDIADLYGMRPASMGSHDRRTTRRETDTSSESTDRPATAADPISVAAAVATPGPVERPPLRAATSRQAPTSSDGAGEGSNSGVSSGQVYRSRLARGSGRGITPPQGSTSSFGATGGSIERDSAGSTGSGSWGRGTGRQTGSRPENRFDDDEFLFALDKSDFATAHGGAGTSGESSKR